jgi:uncharacterized protein YciI
MNFVPGLKFTTFKKRRAKQDTMPVPVHHLNNTGMKTLLATFLLLFISLFTAAQKTNPIYDSVLAKKLGADDFGMKKYVLVILKTGTNTTTEKRFIDSCFGGHMKNISRLVEIGKLIVAGPLGKNEKTYRGIFILNVPTIAEANELVQTDPAVKAGLLAAELFQWYGSAALAEYLPASDKVWKTGF